MLQLLIAAFVVAGLVSCCVTPIVRRFAPALGLIDLPGHRKVHVTPTPRGGGIAIFLGAVVPLLATCMLCLLDQKHRLPGTAELLDSVSDTTQLGCRSASSSSA